MIVENVSAAFAVVDRSTVHHWELSSQQQSRKRAALTYVHSSTLPRGIVKSRRSEDVKGRLDYIGLLECGKEAFVEMMLSWVLSRVIVCPSARPHARPIAMQRGIPGLHKHVPSKIFVEGNDGT